eukprot:scaffold69468_cov67-Phaeocystis_antarctica.AAC.7
MTAAHATPRRGSGCASYTVHEDKQRGAASSAAPQLPGAVHGGGGKVLAIVGGVGAHDAPLVPLHDLDERVVAHRP